MSTLPPKAPAERPTVLCVDDEPQVLLGLGLHLKRHYDFISFTSPQEALQRLEESPVAVIVSDMRMPGPMNGAALLAKVRQRSPDTTRVLLTGHAELDAAISAVNDGQLFRFLTKPCPPETLLATVKAAVEQHRLITSEKVLLQQTVRGAIAALVDVLAMASPLAFGRARRNKQLVQGMARAAGLKDAWPLELAAELCDLGAVALAPETLEKLYRRSELTERERAQVAKVPAQTHKLLQHIPRLEPVWAILDQLSKPVADRALPAKLLAAASAYDDHSLRGASPPEAIEGLIRTNQHEPEVLNALSVAVGEATQGLRVSQISLSMLQTGQVLAGDVFGKSGTLLIAKGTPITTAAIERLRNIAEGTGVCEPLRVWERGPRA